LLAAVRKKRGTSRTRRVRMLFADKRALRTNLKVELLEIREKELRFYTTNTSSIGIQAAFFAGFASTALMTPVPREPMWLHAAYLIFTIASLGLQLGVVVSASLLVMVAPGLALRGPDGSMNVAVDSMISEYRSAFKRLLVGMIALHFSTICFVWLNLAWAEALLLTMCILCSLYLIITHIRKLMLRFQLPAEHVVTGKFDGEEARRAGTQSGLKDRTEISTISTLIQEESAWSARARAMREGKMGLPSELVNPAATAGGEIVE